MLLLSLVGLILVDDHMTTLLNQRSHKQGDVPVWFLIRKELFLQRRRLAYASLAVIGALCLHTLMYSITSVTSAWFAGPPSMLTDEIVLRSEGVHVATTTGSGRGEESLFHSIPLDFQGPSSLDEKVLSAPSFKIDKCFFSADGAGKKKNDWARNYTTHA